MATIAGIVVEAPAATHGYPVERPASSGVWRWVVELADPLALTDVEWHDITAYYAGDRAERGADEYMGRYRASVVQVQLVADDDRLAPWGIDTSAVFGVNVELDAGLLMRAGMTRVVAGSVVEWDPIWTGRVETWGDASQARGQIRSHTVTVVDTIGDLVNVPFGGFGEEEPWDERIEQLLDFQVPWVFGYDIEADATGSTEVPVRGLVSSAISEMDATLDPFSLVWRSRRTGRIVIHPAPYAGSWPNPLLDDYPAGLVFNYSPGFTDIEYVVDDAQTPAGVERTSAGVINSIAATFPGPTSYLVDDPTSQTKFGVKPTSVSWIVENEAAIDDMLTARAFASVQALPLRTTSDHDGFWPAMARIDHLDPITFIHATRSDGVVVTAVGTVRSITEERTLRHGAALTWVSTVQMDVTSTTAADALLPVENLALFGIPFSNGAQFDWDLPTQPFVTPTDVQVRIIGHSPIWMNFPVDTVFFSIAILDPDTEYMLQVRLIREVDGLITNASAIRSITFTTAEATLPTPGPDPGGDDPGDTTVDIPDVADEGCDLEWELQRDDGTGWTTVLSGDQDDLVDNGDGTYSLNLDESEFDPDFLYRVRSREVCGGIEGEWFTGAPWDPPDDWTDPCTTPPSLSVAPFDDPGLVVYVPKICSPDTITEAVSGIAGVEGDAFGGLLAQFDDDQYIALSSHAAGSGIVAYGQTNVIDAAEDITLTIKVGIGTVPAVGEYIRLLEINGIRLVVSRTDSTHVTFEAWLYTAAGGTIQISETAYALGTYTIKATHDVAATTLKLFVDDVEVAESTAAGARINALPAWVIGLPADSWATDAAAIAAVIEAPFTPASLGAKLLAWYDAADTSTITGASAASLWADKAGNGRDVVQNSGASQPALVAAGLNGNNILRFDGTDDHMFGAFDFMFDNGTIEIWAVVKSDESGIGVIVAEGSVGTTNTAYRILDIDATDDYQFNYDNNSNVTRFALQANRSTNAWDLIIATDSGAATGSRIEVVDVGSAGFTAYTRDVPTSFDRFAIGAMKRLATTLFFDGDIAEIIILDTAATSGERSQLADYLNTKWGQSWTPA